MATPDPPPPPDEPAPRKPRRWLRYVIVLGALLLLIAALAGIKIAQITRLIAFGQQMEAQGPPPEAISTARARTTAWEIRLAAVGSVTGVERVNVSNEDAGTVSRINFESGEVVDRGRVLVELDTSTERAQLAAAKARRDLAKVVRDRTAKLLATGAIAREELDRADAALASATGEADALAAQIERKTVRAPFAGKLGIRAVDLGQYLPAGSTITTLESTSGLYVDFALPQQEVSRVRAGMPVQIELPGTGERASGTVIAIDPTIDVTTRSVRLRARVKDPRNLHSGMFVRATVVLPQREQVVIIPATAVVHAAYGDSVFVVEPKPPGSKGMTKTPDGKVVEIARQQFVRLGEARGDFVVVTKGIAAGAEVVSAGAFKLRNGSPVFVDNTQAPHAELDPHPPNR